MINNKEEETVLFRSVLSLYGHKAQTMMFIEEVGEALQAISHQERGRCTKAHVLEELVDICVVIKSIQHIYGTTKEFDEIYKEKIDRLRQRMCNAANNITG